MIYFDNAATTLQKPPSVVRASSNAMQRMTSPGRGSYEASDRAAEVVFACREAAAKLFHVPTPEQVVLTFHATHGLNIAIKTLVKPGDTVLISGYEHNAVLRPLSAIPEVQIRVVATPLFQPDLFLEQMERELKQGVDVVVCNHVSNAFGYILPVEKLAKLCEAQQIPMILDASQSAGVLPVHLEELNVAFIAMPGHKGLYGPQGTGILLCGQQEVEPLLEGGTGSLSALRSMPDFLPDRLEAGTQNIPGVAGLLQGLQFVQKKGISVIARHETKLKEIAAKGMESISALQVFHASNSALQTGVLSFRVKGVDCGEVGAYLSQHQIAVRTGLHCAPLAHETAGTVQTGTVRLSFSAFNREREVDRFLSVMRRFPKK